MITISTSTRREDYEILIRKRNKNNFAAYCPQLNKILQSDTFEQAFYNMKTLIIKHIKLLADEPVEVFRTILPIANSTIDKTCEELKTDTDCIKLSDNINFKEENFIHELTHQEYNNPKEEITNAEIEIKNTSHSIFNSENIQENTSTNSNQLEENTHQKEPITKKYKRINLLSE